MASYLPIRGSNRSSAIRIDGQTITSTSTAYVDISKASVRKELANHLSVGQIYTVGPISANNLDTDVTSGGVVTAGAGLTVNVSAGELKVSSTGAYVTGAAATNFALTAANGSQDRTDLIHWDNTTGAVGKTDGTLAAAGSSVAPATPAGKTPLASVLVAATVTVPGTITDKRPRP
jgi:hypothetical protein